MLASSFWASRTNFARRVTVVTSFHNMMGLLSRPTLPKRKSVTHVSERAPPMSPVYASERAGISLSRLGWGRTTETLAQHNRHLGGAAAGAVKANFAACQRPGHVPVFVKFHGPALPLRPRRAADCNFRQEGTSGCCTGAALGSCSADNGTGRRRCGYTTASKPLRCITGTGLYPGTDRSDRQLVVRDLPHSRSSRMARRAM